MRSRCAGAFPPLRLEGELGLTRELRVVPRYTPDEGGVIEFSDSFSMDLLPDREPRALRGRTRALPPQCA